MLHFNHRIEKGVMARQERADAHIRLTLSIGKIIHSTCEVLRL